VTWLIFCFTTRMADPTIAAKVVLHLPCGR
jgi:hypothetical protein